MDSEAGASFFRREVIRQQPSVPPGVGCALICAGHVRVGRGLLIPEVSTHFVSMLWCVAGQITCSADGRGTPLPPGCVSIVTPGTRYAAEILSETAEARFIVFDGPECERALAGSGLWPGTFQVGAPPDLWLDRIAARMAETAPSHNPLTILGLLEVLSHTAEMAVRMAPDKLIFSALQHIHRHWAEPQCTVDTIVRASGANRSTLARHFKMTTGQTMLAYLTGLRMRMAERLLTTTATPVTGVAAAVGIKDPAYFCRCFKHHTGLSPRECRGHSA